MYAILFLYEYVYHCTVAYMSTVGTVHTDYKTGPVGLYVYSLYFKELGQQTIFRVAISKNVDPHRDLA